MIDLDPVQQFLSSFFGTIIGFFVAKKFCTVSAWISIIGGAAMSYYLTPLVLYFMPDKTARHHYAISFLIGLVGMSFCVSIFKVIEYIINNPNALFERFKK